MYNDSQVIIVDEKLVMNMASGRRGEKNTNTNVSGLVYINEDSIKRYKLRERPLK